MSAMFRPPIAVATAIGWRQVLGFGHGDAPFWARVRGAQLAILNRYVPFNVALMVANLAGLGVLLRDTVDPGFILAWGGVMAMLAGVWLVRWHRSRDLPDRGEATVWQFWTVSAEVACFGIAWGELMLHLLPMVTVENQMVLALLSATAMGACGFAAAMLPVCGAVMVVSIAAATLLGLPSWSPLASPMVVVSFATFTILILRGIVVSSFAMMARMRTQADHAEASATIGLLLGEFEANGSDWLIEVDARGCLTHVSPRLCEVAGRPREALLGARLIDLLGPDRRDPAVRGAVRTTGQRFTARTAFRDLCVPVTVRGELRWWSLTATPKLAPDGSFAGFRGVGTDVTDVRRAAGRIAELARFDPLTGLANRTLVRETIEAALGTGGCALLFVDLDRFKTVNDTYGHAAGDRLLQQVAARLHQSAGPTARLGRLGGDEFAVVLAPPNPRRAGRVAHEIVGALSQPFVVDGQSVVIGASVGWALGPEDGATVDALLRAADLALYEVKGAGRGDARRFTARIAARAAERRALEADLARALDRDELSLAFQPVIETADERVSGFEALLRWTHPTLGEIPPAKFIPVAEDTGLIVRIGAWVIAQACAQAARWPADIRIAVNLSALQFDDPDLVATIARALADNGVAADRLELEITESVFLNERPATRTSIARLKALGVRFALDDFGTGYSSLSYLRKLEFSRIKIDRSFVQRAAARETESTAIIQAIVAMAQSLGMATTAEGTETRAEFESCRQLGCEQVQGYFFGRPMPAEDATALVRMRQAA